MIESKAVRAIYDFAQGAEKNGSLGIHLSVHDVSGKQINLFFERDEAERLFRGLRSAVGHIVESPTSEESDGSNNVAGGCDYA